MSDVHSKTTKDAAEALWTLLGKPEWKLRDIADVIQAAEERGRRRGVEEAAKCPDCGGALESFCGSDKCRDAAIKAWSLAPRDSAPQMFTPDEARALWQVGSCTPGSVASEPLESALAKLLPMAEADGARRHYLGNGCLWVQGAPRDSGKEG